MGFRTLRSQHGLATVVAVLIASTALWYGGNPPEIIAAISMVTWWAVALGVAFGLIPVSRLTGTALIPFLLLASVAVLTGLSFFWSNNEGVAFDELVQMTCIIGLFGMALLCSSRGSARGWLQGIAFGLGFLVILAALSRFFPGLGDDAELRESLFGSVGRLSWPLGYWNAMGALTSLAIVTVGWFGAFARDARWRHASIALLPTFFLVLYLTSSRGALGALIIGGILLFLMERRRKGLLISTAFGVLGGVVLVLVAAPMYDLVHAEGNSNARIEGFALLAVTIAVTAAIYLLLKKFESRIVATPVPRPNLLVWAGIGIVVVIGLVAFNPVKQVNTFISAPNVEAPATGDENRSTYHLISTEGNGRWQYWTAATSAFRDEPLAGIGAGGYRDYYTNHRETLIYGLHAHSLPLLFLGELGLIGFLLATGFLILVVWTGWKRWASDRGPTTGERPLNADSDSPYATEAIPVFATLVLTGMVSMSLDWTSEFPVIAAPVLIAMACLAGQATVKPGRQAEPSFLQKLTSGSGPGQVRNLVPKELAPVLLILVSGTAILFSTWGFGISTNVQQSKEALADDQTEKAIEEAKDAVELAPWSEATLMQLAAGQELNGNYIGALNTLDRATKQAPLDSAPWFAKSRLQVALDDVDAGLASILKARELDPFAPFFEQTRIEAEYRAAYEAAAEAAAAEAAAAEAAAQ